MSGYARPAVDEQAFTNADGSVINYGDRWDGELPPLQTYSVSTHPERFAPLHTIADALVEYLHDEFDVSVTDDLSCAEDLLRPARGAIRAVRVVPAADDAAALTFVYTDYPGLVVHAGLVHDFAYPSCGCDACDETWGRVADDLEEAVRAIVSGGYREQIRRRHRSAWVSYEFIGPDGSSDDASGGSERVDDPTSLQMASERLALLPTGTAWAPWARRARPESPCEVIPMAIRTPDDRPDSTTSTPPRPRPATRSTFGGSSLLGAP